MITIGWLVYICQVKDEQEKLPNAWELSYAESHIKTAKWDSHASLINQLQGYLEKSLN